MLKQLIEEEARYGLDSLAVYRGFSDRAFRNRDELNGLLHSLTSQGQRVLGYGASTKGNVVLQFCGITPKLIPAIAEVNSDKFGCYTPQTLIPIISEAEAHASNPDVLHRSSLAFPRQHYRKRTEILFQSGGELLFPLPAIELLGTTPVARDSKSIASN